MTDHVIVSCPGCGKRYSVPPGVPPGQFQCQDCSAVVAYGQGGAVAAPPKGGGSARTRAKATAAKKRTARGRRDEPDDDEGDDRRGGRGAAKDRKSPMPYILGFATMAALAGIVAYLATRDSGAKLPVSKVAEAPKPAASVGLTGPTGGLPPQAQAPGAAAAPTPAYTPPPPAPAPKPEPAPRGPGLQTASRSAGVEQKAADYKEVANPPSGGNYGKSQSQLLMMIKDNRPSVIAPLDHLPDTPPDVAQKIDEAMGKVLDVNSGTAAIRAKDALIKIGRPAIPKVLSALAKFDFSKYGDATGARDECVVADYVDEIMREITAYPKGTRLQYSPEARLGAYQAAAEEWYVWWLTMGYKRETFYKKVGEDEDDKL
jgi:hypothetical protein